LDKGKGGLGIKNLRAFNMDLEDDM